MLAVLCILYWVTSVSSLPSGAPDMVCDAEVKRPNHPFEPQSTQLLYDISASSSSVDSEKGNITVTICTPPDVTFRGFLVLAYNDKNETFGHWDSSDVARANKCGITHNSPIEKSNATLIWHPPKGTDDINVVFKAVIVKQFSTFWIDVPVPIVSGKTCNQTIESSSSN